MKQSPQAPIEKETVESYIREKKLIGKVRRSAIRRKIPIIDDNVGYFLSVISLLYEPENILEIGCGTGYSTYFLLKSLDDDFKYTGIDLNGERLSEAENFIRHVFSSKFCSKKPYQVKLNFIHGNATKIIPGLKEKFDLVFIDAAKWEYPEYIRSIKSKLDKEAIVIADNIFYKKKLFSKKLSRHDYNSVLGIRDYLEFIESSDLFENHFFDIGDGLVFSKYKDNPLKKIPARKR